MLLYTCISVVAVLALFELNVFGCVCRDRRITRSHVHLLEPPSLVSLSVSSLLVQWAHVWRNAFFFFFTSFLLFVRLRKVINHAAPAGEGSCSMGPTLPPWGTSFESYNPFLDPHFSVCGRPKKEGTPNLSYFTDAHSISHWFSYRPCWAWGRKVLDQLRLVGVLK